MLQTTTLSSALPAQATDVNLLINNAGILAFGNILEVPIETISSQFDTNFYGSLNMARAFVPVIERNQWRRDRQYADIGCTCQYARTIHLQRF